MMSTFSRHRSEAYLRDSGWVRVWTQACRTRQPWRHTAPGTTVPLLGFPQDWPDALLCAPFSIYPRAARLCVSHEPPRQTLVLVTGLFPGISTMLGMEWWLSRWVIMNEWGSEMVGIWEIHAESLCFHFLPCNMAKSTLLHRAVCEYQVK